MSFGIPVRNGLALGLGTVAPLGNVNNALPAEDVLLQENRSNILQEDGSNILLES